MAYTKEDLEKRLAQMIAERGGKSDQIINSSTILGQVRAIQKAHRARAESVDAEADIYGRSGGDPKPSRSPEPKAAAKKAPAKKAPAKKAGKSEPKKEGVPKNGAKASGTSNGGMNGASGTSNGGMNGASGTSNGGMNGASGDAKPRMEAAHPVYDAISKNAKDNPKTGLNRPLLQIVFGKRGNRTNAEAAEAASKKRIR